MLGSRRARDAQDQPDRNHDDRAEQEIAPHPANRVEAHVPDGPHHAADAFDNVAGVEAERMQNYADQDAEQDQPEGHRQRRSAEKAADAMRAIVLKLFTHDAVLLAQAYHESAAAAARASGRTEDASARSIASIVSSRSASRGGLSQ